MAKTAHPQSNTNAPAKPVKVEPFKTKGPTEAAVIVHSPAIDLDYWKGVYKAQGMTFKDFNGYTTFYPPEKVNK